MKRLVDIVLAGSAIIVLLPVMAGVAAAIWIVMGRPILFRQVRPGLNGRAFAMYKFRTMSQARDGEGRLLPDAQRLGRLGRFLRSSSLDELPELINVMRGDMSLVGPRPLLMQYLDRYTAEQKRRHEVRPGITGWAQVNGRNALSWDEKFACDVWYVDNRSLLLDIRIMLMTILRLLRPKGISAEGEATMPEYMGRAGRGEPLDEQR